MEIREIRETDLNIIRSWYDDYEGWIAPPLDSLPNNGLGGLLVHKGEQLIASAYLYETNSKLCHLEWVIADKNYEEEDRHDAISLLIATLTQVAKVKGYGYVFTYTQHESLMNKYEEIGFIKNPTASHDLILKL